MASSTASSLLSMIPHSDLLSPDIMRKVYETTLEQECHARWPLVMDEFQAFVAGRVEVLEQYEDDYGSEGHPGISVVTTVTPWGQGKFTFTTQGYFGWAPDHETHTENLVYTRSGKGRLEDVLDAIEANHLNPEVLSDLQGNLAAGLGPITHPIPTEIQLLINEEEYDIQLPSRIADASEAPWEKVLEFMRHDSQALQGQVALQLYKFC